ncbi:glycosyl transferase [Paenibacillus rigui]|uniref:Glycosyl transferase n=2 Tax=Paenibacillus rigui TaxID=554312 RepID=A0A229UUW7_9BACL|nr:glycosyl transferase [Paenibacillus rigui]
MYGHFEVPSLKRSPEGNVPPTRFGKKVTIILLTWNGLDYTRLCLDSLKPTVIGNNVDVIVFDNGSTDGTVAYLRTLPWIKLLTSHHNIGFVAGNNIALAHSDPASDVLLLNNDMIIQQGNWLHLLQETAYQAPNIGIVGCRLCGVDGKLHHAGTYIYPDNLMGHQIGGLETDVNQYSFIREVQGIVFACAYIKREVLNALGGLDSRFFSYFEDTDFCLSAIQAGFKVVYDGRVNLTHFHNTSTRVNNVSFWDMYNKSKEVFRQKWQLPLCAQYENGVNFRSTVNLPIYGYAESAKNLMLSLDQQKLLVSYRYLYGPGTPIGLEESADDSDQRILFFRNREFHPGYAEIVYGQGDAFYRNTGRYKIGFTMLEVNGLPAEWVRQCNLMNEVWVPSHFNAATFRASGVRVPIHVIPLGIDPQYFNPGIRSHRMSDRFTFLSIFEWGERKAPELLLRTFARTFNLHDNVLLICKITNHDPSIDVPTEIRKLNLGPMSSRILILHNNRIPSETMGSLYRSADCFVLPTRGEGWGMPIMEAMACGLPTIATAWSAQTDFLNENTGYPLHIKGLVPAEARCTYYQGLQWAEPDTDHLSFLMRYVYEHQDIARARGLHASQQILTNWAWSRSGDHMKQRLIHI